MAWGLLRLSLPMVLGVVAVISISLVDTYFVGQLGTAPQAALSFCFPVTLSVASLAIGLGAGAGSVVSRAIGAERPGEAKRRSTDSLVLAVMVVGVVCGLGYVTAEPLFRALGADPEVLPLIVRYMRIWYLSMPFLVVPMVANALIRANGDAVVPSIIMIGAAALNVGLTPALIFGRWGLPELGFDGAAVSTLVARAGTFVAALAVLVFRERLLTFDWPGLPKVIASWRKIAKVGIPAAAGNMVNPIGVAAVTALLAGFGGTTVAGFGVATRIGAFASIPMLAMSASIGPVAGQNWGADRRDRVERALTLSYGACLLWALAMAALLYGWGDVVAGILASSPEVAAEAMQYLTVVPVTLCGYGVVIVGAGAFNALGHSVLGLGYHILRTVGLYVPLSWLALSWGDDSGAVYGAIAASNAVAGVAVATFTLGWIRRSQRELSPAGPISEAAA